MLQLLIRNEIIEDRTIPLRGSMLLVGRDKEAHIRIHEAAISRFHARFDEQADHGFVLIDLGSSNGTFVNEVRITAPTPVEAGDDIRFGTVRAEIQEVQDPEEAGGVPASRSRKRPPAILVSGVLFLLLLGTAAWIVHRARDESPTETGPNVIGAPADPLPPSGEKVAGPVPSEPLSIPVQPEPEPGTITSPDSKVLGTGPPAHAGAPPKPDALSTLQLRDGRTLRARILERADPIRWVVQEEGRADGTLVPREDVVAVDGVPAAPDLEAIFRARLKTARDIPRLLELARWCERLGLSAERKIAAQAALDSDPENDEASAVLGRFRHRGAWKTRDAMAAEGLLSADGSPLGSDADLFEIRRLHLDLLGRPPLREELSKTLAETRSASTERLVRSPERWLAWIEEQALALMGTEGPTLARAHRGLADGLANGSLDFRQGLRALAASDALRIRWPDQRTLARRLLEVLLGPSVPLEPAMLEAAGRMIAGERVALFGDRGASRDDFLEIVMRQPAFYRRQVEVEGRRCLARPLTRDEVSKAAQRLAASPMVLPEISRDWLVRDDAVQALASPRRKDDAQFLRSLFIDALGRLPGTSESAGWLQVLAETAEPAGLRSAVVPLFTRAATPVVPPDPGDPSPWIRDRFRRILARSPAPGESAAIAAALAEGRATPQSVVTALLMSPEYELY